MNQSSFRFWRRWAAGWASCFAGVHVYWLAGGRLWLPRDVWIVPGSPLFLAALVAVPLLASAGLLAMRVGRPSLLSVRRQASWLLGGVWAFCLLHALPPLAKAGWHLVQGDRLLLTERQVYALTYEINWFIGGALFLTVFIALRQQELLRHQ